jgi:hypothetical protein
MRLSLSSLGSLLFVVVCTGCEVRVGNADWDAAGFWDEDDDWFNEDRNSDPWDSPSKRDAGKPTDEEDAGKPGERDAATGGETPDAGTPASMLDAAVMNPTDEPDEEPITIGMVAELMARGSCGALSKCMGEQLLRESLRGQDCVPFRTQVYANRELYWLASSVARGRVTFRPELLEACEIDLIGLGCDVQSRRLPSSCRDALEGKAEVDETCAIDQECAGNAYCNKGLMESCPGACASLQSSGLPCLASSECSDGLVCRRGTCAKPLVEGESCTVHLGYGECSPGLVCQGAAADQFTCRSVKSVYAGKEGDACDKTDKLCELGLVCQSQSETSVMGKCAKPAAAGGVCRLSEPGQCPSGFYCKDARAEFTTRAPAGRDGICAELPGDGKACVAALGCKPGAICSSVDNTCHDRKGVGETCVENAQCYTSSCTASSKCAAPLDCSP